MSVASDQRKRLESKLQRDIEGVYREAEKDIDAKIQDFNRRYKIKEEIHRRDVREGRWTQEQYDSWVSGQVFQGEIWESKRQYIQHTLYNANSIATKMINGQKTNLFMFNANYQAYELEHGAGINFGFGLYDSTSVERLIRDDPQILPMWKIDQPKDYTWNGKKVNNAIRQGIIQGESLNKIARRLTVGLCTQNKNKMLTFAQTAMTEAQNAGANTRLKEAEAMGLKVHKEWMATLDERTRWQHADLDGQKQPLDKPFKVGGYEIMYPGDPTAHPSMVYNCRCTLVGDLDDYPAEYERRDNIAGEPIKNMTYREWEKAKGKVFSKSKANIGGIPLKFDQVGIGAARTIDEINNLMNSAGLWKTRTKQSNLRYDHDQRKWVYDTVDNTSKADLTGCDLDAAKSIAASYEQIFAKYPQLVGRFDAPNAKPHNMGENTYAWCYARNGGMVQVNPKWFGDWAKVAREYERDVISRWHPYGTAAESIVVHEVGHAIDGLLAQEGILGGYTKSGEFRYASSSLKNTVMKRVAKTDPDLEELMKLDKWLDDNSAVENYVSRYASKNPREWFAECFAEYITSANPRPVAKEFGKELEKLVRKLK